MSRYRLYPTPNQQAALLRHCASARFVWNLAIEQRSWWQPGRGSAPGFSLQCRQLTDARAAFPWLAEGSSTGELLVAPSLRPAEARRLRLLQRRLARAKRGSNRRARVKRAVARLHARAADRRTNWVEQTSTDLARRFDTIRVEDLNVQAMTKSAKGTVERPGKQVRQKAGLNRGILGQGWGRVVTRLEQKAPGRVEKTPAAFTSQQCHVCGHVAAESRKSQALFACMACGWTGNADVNAARNIAAGRAVPVRGGSGSPGPMNREPHHVASSAA
jgi:putative transposase